MKFTSLILLSVIIIMSSVDTFSQEYYDQMDRFLGQYHSDNGLIDYVDIAKNNKKLDSLYSIIGEIDLAERDESFLKVFYINAYNIIVIKQVVVFYPIEKPFDVSGFFDNIKNKVGNNEYTLDELEKSIIIPQFRDPRIHFALVCAAKGCPTIQKTAFRPETIEAELERITKEVINDPYFVRYENETLYLSKIFSWYNKEFTIDGSLIDFINQYRNESVPEGTVIEFNAYDWSLNEEKS